MIRATECNITLDANEIVTTKAVVNAIRYYYGTEDKLTRKVISPASGCEQTIYYENGEDNTVIKFTAGGRTITSHSKTDSFGRKVFDELQLGTGFVSRQFQYHAGAETDEHKQNAKLKSSATTQLVSQIVLSGGATLSYAYDAEERITSVVETYEIDGVTVTNTTLYTYDALGQLETETVNGITTKFEYDNYGNILAKGVVDETGEITETTKVTYVYGDDTWKDLLTAYNGQAIEYDAQGNPTSYLGHTLTWEKGRQLKSFDNIAYTYNANGIRTSKTVNGVLRTYTLDGTNILRETWDNNTLVPLYDNEDSVCGIIYNNAPYYFQKNLQGDIIGIVDKNAELVAKYTYDAWGVCTITQDTSGVSIATVNPFRYRGYLFDQETNLYYLQSRYYDPVVGRFVNGDEAEFAAFSNDVLQHNLLCYCFNNPVNEDDCSGNISLSGVISSIKGFIGKLINKIWNHILGLFKWNKSKRTISISTSAISTAIDALIAAITNALIYRGLKTGMKLLLKSNKIRTSFVKGMLDFFLNNFWGKKLLWLIYKIGLSIAEKATLIGTVASGVFRSYIDSMWSFKSRLLQRTYSLISALSSVGGIVALFLDFGDKKWDDWVTIKY